MVAELWQNAAKLTMQLCTTPKRGPGFITERIVLVSFLPDGNGNSCVLHPFGCGNILFLNWEDSGVDIHLRFVRHELACCTMNDNGSDGCRVCFTGAREYAVGDNDHRLDGAVVKLFDVFTAEQENCSMHHHFYCNCGYVYAVVLSYATWVQMLMKY